MGARRAAGPARGGAAVSVAAALFPDLEGHWLASWRSDPRAAALYRRHYSAEKNARPGIRPMNFMGPGETLILLTGDCRAMFAWQRNVGAPRLDGQEGVCCTVFRNEGPILSSELIREADQFAWDRWPGARHFTYVDGAKTSRRRSKHALPGKCFIEAGWTLLPTRSKESGLYLLEILPPDITSTPGPAQRRRHDDDGATTPALEVISPDTTRGLGAGHIVQATAGTRQDSPRRGPATATNSEKPDR